MNIQQLPANEETRSSFICEEGNLFCSCDYSAMEARLGADIYNDKAMIDDFLYGTGDSHSLYAWMVFRKECEALGCTGPQDVKKLAPKWRKEVKAVEFAYQFGAAAPTIAQSANCSIEQAQQYIDSLNKGFKGLNSFAINSEKFVKKNGYILMNRFTGHKMFWWDHDKWLKVQAEFNEEGFWDDYRTYHKGTGDEVAMKVKEHFQAGSKWARLARNAPTQGSGAVILKYAVTNTFNWIVDNNYFGIIKFCALVHDEVNIEYPKSINFAQQLKFFMEDAAKKFCPKVPIPAEASISNHWVH